MEIDGSSELGRMLFEAMIEGKGKKGGGKPPEAQGKQADKLLKYFEVYKEPVDFKEGDLIVSKDNMSMWKSTASGRMMVVIEKLAKPKRGSEMSDEPGGANNAASFGSPYSSLLYDIIAAYVDDTGDFVQHYYDSRRFKKYNPKNKVINMFTKE